MRIGVHIGDAPSLDAMIGQVRTAAGLGLDSAYFGQTTSWDALTVAALSGQHVSGIDLGTAVVQTYPRHPLALAGQALTAQAACGNRLTLGIGPSHPQFIEDYFGYSFARPVRHIREYLSALRPLLRGEQVNFRGETLTAVGQVAVPGAAEPSVLVSALRPAMLRVAGELADGTATVWTSPPVIADYIRPTIARAAARAGRPDPRVITIALLSVTAEPDAVVQRFAAQSRFIAQLPSYRWILERQGKSGPHETVVAGDETAVAQAIRRYAEAGTTELVVSPLGNDEEQRRTIKFLASLRHDT
jgi:F420-dependent oxidoreductase-like protein